jgi:hypothetical protein
VTLELRIDRAFQGLFAHRVWSHNERCGGPLPVAIWSEGEALVTPSSRASGARSAAGGTRLLTTSMTAEVRRAMRWKALVTVRRWLLVLVDDASGWCLSTMRVDMDGLRREEGGRR